MLLSTRNLLVRGVICFSLCMSLWGCGGGDESQTQASAPTNGAPAASAADKTDRAARADAGATTTAAAPATPQLPEHDPEARFDGRTALEYAQQLRDLNPRVQAQALQTLARFGVNGLPARDAIKALLETNTTDEVKMRALETLVEIQDPEAYTVMVAKLADPNFLQSDQAYTNLLDAVTEYWFDRKLTAAQVTRPLVATVDTHPEHASRLLRTDLLPDGVLQPVVTKLIKTDLDRATAEYFVRNLAQFSFLDDQVRLDFVRKHPQYLQRHFNHIVNILVSIGTQEALDLAMSLEGLSDDQRYELLVQFARGVLDPQVVMDRLMTDVKAATQEEQINRITAYMERLDQIVRQAADIENNQRLLAAQRAGEINAQQAQEARRAFDGGPRALKTRKIFVDALTSLIKEGPNEHHRSLAIVRLTRFVQRTPAVGIDALAPVFEVLTDSSAPEVVLGTAAHELRQHAGAYAQRDQEWFYKHAAALLWKNQDPRLAEFVEGIWDRGMNWGSIEQRGKNCVLAIDAILEDLDNHLDGWSVNMGAIVITKLNQWLGADAVEIRERAAAGLGKLHASRHANLQYLDRHIFPMFPRAGLGQFQPAIVSLEHNSVDGVISFFEPVIFAQHMTPLRQQMRANQNFNRNAGAVLAGRMNHVARLDMAPRLVKDAEERAKWMAFLKRVVDANDPDFSAHAKTALDLYSRVQ